VKDYTEANSSNINSHAVVVFSGIAGLEAACAADDEMIAKVGGSKIKVSSVFNLWVNAARRPGQKP